jgi:hypothetical protein
MRLSARLPGGRLYRAGQSSRCSAAASVRQSSARPIAPCSSSLVNGFRRDAPKP